MRTRYRIRLGSSYLDAVVSNLAILNIEYSGLERSSSQQTVANLDGYDEVNEKASRQTVTVTFELHIYKIADRNEACRAVNAWAAQGGELRTNDRSGQYLRRVKCEQFATINARDWTAPLTLVFTTTQDPYWRSETVKTKTISGKNASSTMAMDGDTGNTKVSATVTSTKGTVKTIKLSAGDTVLELSGLSIAKNEYVEIAYTDFRYLRIRHYSSAGKLKGSILDKLKPTSSDDLSIPCGKTSEVKVAADNNVKAVLTARGSWL